MHILQHSYNKATQSSTGFSPFEVCLGFQPASLAELPLTLAHQGIVHQQAGTTLRPKVSTTNFTTPHWNHNNTQSSSRSCQATPCKQRTFLTFRPGDKVWLHLDKKRFKGQHHKLLPIRYGPYTILDKIGENAYKLDLPPQLGIHNVIDVNHLKLFELPLLEEPFTITHPVNSIPDVQIPVAKDTLLGTRTHSTRHRVYTSYPVAH